MLDIEHDSRFAGVEPLPNRVWLASPTMHGEERKYVKEAFDTNWVTTAGSNITAIEDLVSEYMGCEHAVALASGTSALHLAVKLAGEKLYGQAEPSRGTLAGKRVFCSDVTFDASVNPVAYEDGEAIYIDTEYDTWNMDPEALEVAFRMYPEVRLIILTHLYGTPCKIEEIRRIADKYGALIVEDAAESMGAKVLIDEARIPDGRFATGSERVQPAGNGRWIETGTLGDYNAISFNGNKIITGSSGGMFLTNSAADADKIRKWSTQSREAAPWYQHEEVGYNYRMSNVIAGVVRGQLPYLEEHIDRKREIYERYREGFKGLPVKMNPYDKEKTIPNFWLSCMIIDREAMARQVRGAHDYMYETESGKSTPHEILDALNHFGFEGRPVWKPMHKQPIYRMSKFITVEGNGRGRSNAYITGSGVDVGADIFMRGLCLPSDIKMTDEEQDVAIEVIRRCFS